MAKSLIGTLPIYAQHLAEQTGVKVVVQGKRAFTDGKTVTVPFSEDDLPLSFGFIAHECSHVRNTDMSVFMEVASTPFRKNLLNILEDIRIERLSMDQYPGTEDDIRYLNRKVLLDPFDPEHLVQANDIQIVHNAILMGGYWKLQEPQLEVPGKAYLDALAARLGDELADKIMGEVQKTLRCNSTREVLELVDAIIELLPSNEDQPEPEDKPDQGEDEEDNDGESERTPQGESEGETGDTGDEEGASTEGQESKQDGETESAESSGGGDDGEGKGQPDSEQKSTPDGQGESAAPSTADNTQPGAGQDAAPLGLREQAMQATDKDLQGLISEVGDAAAEMLGRKAASTYTPFNPFPLGGRAIRRSAEASIRRQRFGEEHSAGLRQILNGLLQAQVDCRVRLKRQGRRIDTSRIAMLSAGETRVFRSKARSERQSAAIQFLFDKSGSMDAAMDQAEAALYAVLKSLEGLPLVTTGAMSFPGTNQSGNSESCDLIKRSTERLSTAVQAGGFGSLANGGTPMAPAIWPAAVEVLRAKGERKILLVITDGSPNSGSESYCKEMYERCEASGIEVIGLGFGEANSYVLSKLFKKYVAVGTVSKLRAALFGVVRETLTA
ncbi:VWA domain-containing protein (plasmid) [Stutzerimonas degradans]|nr:VWA domain-containing protein [Stutzerimonas degradans]